MRISRLQFSSVCWFNLDTTEGPTLEDKPSCYNTEAINPVLWQYARGEWANGRSEFPEISAVQDLKGSSAPTALVWGHHPVMDKFHW